MIKRRFQIQIILMDMIVDKMKMKILFKIQKIPKNKLNKRRKKILH